MTCSIKLYGINTVPYTKIFNCMAPRTEGEETQHRREADFLSLFFPVTGPALSFSIHGVVLSFPLVFLVLCVPHRHLLEAQIFPVPFDMQVSKKAETGEASCGFTLGPC